MVGLGVDGTVWYQHDRVSPAVNSTNVGKPYPTFSSARASFASARASCRSPPMSEVEDAAAADPVLPTPPLDARRMAGEARLLSLARFPRALPPNAAFDGADSSGSSAAPPACWRSPPPRTFSRTMAQRSPTDLLGLGGTGEPTISRISS